MKLNVSQHSRLDMRIAQSPQMIQAMQVLQLPVLELEERIQQELQENVFLETSEASSRDEPDAAAAAQPDARGAADRALERSYETLEYLERRALEMRPPRRRFEGEEEGDGKAEALQNAEGRGPTLHEHLVEQLRLQDDLPPWLLRAATHVACSLDAKGRLTATDEELAAELGMDAHRIQEAVELVRQLDPPGVAARDLRESLLLQLDALPDPQPLEHALVERHLDDLAMNRMPKIAKETGATFEEIREAVDFIRQHLHPYPGSEFTSTVDQIIVPDVVVEEVEGRYEVRIERERVPELTLSRVYRRLLEGSREDPKVFEYLRRKIESARSFIDAVHQRHSTLKRVSEATVRMQEEFLRNGIQHLRPMRMQDLADEVGVHISTVSRAISGKYMQTPVGIFEMRRFFGAGTVSDTGRLVSQTAVKDKIREIVEKEDRRQPLSDDDIVARLAEQGLTVARRTVSKYRKALGIPSSSLRKDY